MSLSTILNAGMSGLQTAETQLRVVSDNVANVATPGYVRKIVDQVSTATDGIGTGVDVSRVRIATDAFLQQANLNAASGASQADTRSELYDRVQSLFGDPSASTGFFADINALFSSISATADDPSSAPRRQEVVTNAKQIFDDASTIASGIQEVRTDADSRIASTVDQINGLLTDIEDLNHEISRSTVSGKDASGAETQQAQLIDQLSQLMDVRVGTRVPSGVTIRTGDGVLLAGNGAATLSYTRAGVATPQTTFNEIWVTPPGGSQLALSEHLSSGQLKGLIDIRDRDAPQAADRLAELTSQLADQLNVAHNANTAFPAPSSLTGKNTGLDLPSAISGFTGKTTVAIADASGVMQRKVDIDFTAGTMSVNGGGAVAFTPATFLTTLNTSLGASGSASFANGALTISATGANGVAIANDATTPSAKAGRSFSLFFGMNDLIRSDQIATYDTGLTNASQNGFTPGQTITFRMSSDVGSRLTDITVAVPAAGTGTMADLLTALNDPSTGLGRYGSFALDANGKMGFTSSLTPAPTLSVIADNTTRGAGGPSFSGLFGIGTAARTGRADSFSVRTDIDNDPRRLALAQLDPTAAVGANAISAGDGRGAIRLADAAQQTAMFDPAGGASGGAMTVSRYLADVAGDIGGKAATAATRKTSADALLNQAQNRRAASEGVNLDEELVKLTTFQQAYNASARLIQAAKDMYDVLIGMTH